jgi:uncharacterized membrane protein YfhO
MKKADLWLGKSSKERYWIVFLIGFIIMITGLMPLIIKGNGIYIYYGDYNFQQIPFYNLVNDAVREGQFGWNWYTDLGTDLISSYSFYLFGSPFFWLSVILPRWAVTYSMPVLLALKHGVATLTAYIYIRKFVRGRTNALTGALLYAFSGFQIYNIFFNHFQDVTAFFPLLLIALEENINNHRKGVFAVTVALMALVNYYFFCGQVVFLIIYYLFRMKCHDFHTSWKKFFLLWVEAIIGTAIAAVILVPTFMSIINNPRVDNKLYGTDILLYEDQRIIPKIIQAFFMPPDVPMFPNLFYSKLQGLSIGGYFPLIGMLGVITYMRTHKKHWATRLSWCLIIFAFVPVLNSLFQAMNGCYYARWFYMPILIFTMMSARTIDEDDVSVKPAMIFSLTVLGVLIILSLMPTKFLDSVLYFSLPKDIFYFFIGMGIALFSLLVAGYIFDLKKRGKSFEKAMLAATAVFSLALIYNTLLYGYSESEIEREIYIPAGINGADDVYEKASEDNFFRADMTVNYDNYPMLWKMPCVATFHSVVEPSVFEFYNSIGISRDVASDLSFKHYYLRGLLSVKYFYLEKNLDISVASLSSKSDGSSDEDSPNKITAGKIQNESKEEFDLAKELPGFELVVETEYFKIYENKLFIPMGIAYDHYISEAKAERMKAMDRERILMRSLVLSDEQISKYADILTEWAEIVDSTVSEEEYIELCKEKQQNCCDSFSFDSYGFTSEIELEKPELIFFSVPYSSGWSAEVNGKAVDVEKVDHGLMAVRAESGNNKIVFHYETPGLRYGIIISCSAVLMLVIYLLICRKIRGKGKKYGITHSYDYKTYGGSVETEYIDRVFASAEKSADESKNK